MRVRVFLNAFLSVLKKDHANGYVHTSARAPFHNQKMCSVILTLGLVRLLCGVPGVSGRWDEPVPLTAMAAAAVATERVTDVSLSEQT